MTSWVGEQRPYGDDIEAVLITEEQIKARTIELAESVAARFRDIPDDLVLIGVLKGAVMFMTDFRAALPIPSQMEFMAVSSYGSSTSSSGSCASSRTLTATSPTATSSSSKTSSTPALPSRGC